MIKNYLIILTLFLYGCSLQEFSAPDWDTRFKLFFPQDAISMVDLLEDESFRDSLGVGFPDTLIYVSITDTTEKQRIERKDLSFKADDKKIPEELGVITLKDPDPATTTAVSFAEVFPGLQVGDQLDPTPPMLYEPPGQNIELNTFEQVEVDSGRMIIVIHNNFIFDIQVGLEVRVHDALRLLDPDRGIIDTVLFTDAIPAGQSAESNSISLAGKSFSNNLFLEFVIPLAGTQDTITITQDDLDSHFFLDLILRNLQVISAVAEIPPQTLTEEDNADIDTEDKNVREVKIAEGNVHLAVENYMNLGANLEITLLNMFEESGDPKIIPLQLDPGFSTAEQTVSIGGLTFKNHLQSGEFIDRVEYSVIAITEDSGEMVEVTSEDSIVVFVTMDSAYVDYFEGEVQNVDIPIDPVEKDDIIDLSKLDGSFSLPDLILEFTFYNEIDFDISFDLVLTAIRENEQGAVEESKTINISETLNRGSNNNPSKTIIILDANSSTPSIVDLMAILPTKILISGEGLVNGDGKVTLSDAVWAEYKIESPLSLLIEEPLSVTSDPDSLTDFDEDTQEALSTDLSDVSIVIEGLNGLPLGGIFKFFLGTDSTTLFNEQIQDSSQKIILTTFAETAEIGANGLSNDPAPISANLVLTKKQLQIFNNDPLYFGAKIEIESTDQKVTFRKNDALDFSGYVEFKYRVDVDNE